MSKVRFINPGEIDLRLVTTLGVNVKSEGSSPIGYFGTGLKYAIAVLLREGQEVTIWSGRARARFELKKDSIRGKEFDFIVMNTDMPGGNTILKYRPPASQELGFTTELGKNWTLRDAYRELWSNCKDESGEVEETKEELAEGWPERTCIEVAGEEFLDQHISRWEFLLNPGKRLLEEVSFSGWMGGPTEPLVDIYAGESSYVFYRGIGVWKSEKELKYTYNIREALTLREDRTCDNWHIEGVFATMVANIKSPELLKPLLMNKDSVEMAGSQLSYVNNVSGVLLDEIEQVLRTSPHRLPVRAVELYNRLQTKGKIQRKELALSGYQAAALAAAIEFCSRIGFSVNDYPIKVAEELDSQMLGLAEGGIIWLSKRTFELDAELELTLIEEFVHLRNGVSDYSREMQNVLFREIVRLGQRLIRGMDEG